MARKKNNNDAHHVAAHESSPEIVTQIEKYREIGRTVRAAIYGLFVVAAVAVSTFPARELAGQQTEVNFQFALGVTVTATIAGGAGVFWGRQQRKKADEALVQKEDYKRRLGIAQAELESVKRRLETFESDESRRPVRSRKK